MPYNGRSVKAAARGKIAAITGLQVEQIAPIVPITEPDTLEPLALLNPKLPVILFLQTIIDMFTPANPAITKPIA